MKVSLSNKVSRFMILTIGSIVICLFAVGFVSIWKMRVDTIGQRQKQDAELFSRLIGHLIDHQVDQIKIYTLSPLWQDAVKEANLRYAGWEPKAIKEYMARMDGSWAALTDDQLPEWLGSRMGKSLKILAEQDRAIAEIFLTDRYGGLVAASGKTSDFYQADEEWWQRAYRDGKGDDFFGEVELDQSSGKISCAIAVPVKDETGQVIGIVKAILDVGVFFKEMELYKFGRTGHSALIDGQGRVIYHAGLKPMSTSPMSGILISRILGSDHDYMVIHMSGREGKSLVAAARIESPYLERNGIHWVSIISQEVSEIILPLYKIFGMGLILILAIFFLVTINMRMSIKDIIISPLQKIRDGIQHVSRGEQGYIIDLKTGDEIEDLGDAFNQMAQDLKKTSTSVEHLNKEIAEREKAENKLREALKGEIKTREIVTSMLADNNKIREELESKLTELKQAQDMLVQSEKLASLGKLVADMAHEVNNPLMIISGNAQLSLLDLSLSDEVKNNLRIIFEECNRAKNIIQRLLMFSRPSRGEQKPVDINMSIGLVVGLLEHQYSLSNVKVNMRFNSGLSTVTADDKQLQEVFMNLLNNARDALPGGGVIDISTFLDGGYLKIEIKDSGMGMDEKTLSRLFEPFFTTKEKGTGLGLAMCYGLIKAHNGKLEIRSQQGKGTTVHIWLPLIGGGSHA